MTTTTYQKLERNALGRLVLTDEAGQRHEAVVPVRAHPISAPDEGVSLVGQDGHELLWVNRLSDLPAPERELLESELASRDFMPSVLSIKKVSTFSTPSQWTVETDRGETQFILRTEEDIRRLGEGRLLIASSHGLQLLVPDRFALDKGSKKILERFL
ncbi:MULTISPECIES: cyanophycin metabolism-associated DUF1854 family protein [unclassified Roseateles]|uniref:cyanophycin metabolism-associated DUF1854 family protein n=1 Tax=unclassified Roseateles TaxID=2626991 RepID=UPI000733A710|nr:DUF1854 domain-containing protein [Paucibacter sp. KCTC 42545]ALT75994.1 hypothetical protein AT984_00950 [Paucibacter sp. KCTC 42545]MBY0235046.1 DUF1854 domain-containing protein [Burkholderiaceae bacterium]